MKTSTQRAIHLLAGAAIVVVACGSLRAYFSLQGTYTFYVPAPALASPADASTEPVVPPRVGVPARIMIPNISVDAAIEKVALAADGSMDVPTRPLDTAWYELGARPGETGSAVIAGHVDWKLGATAVFADLHKLTPGDMVNVEDDAGTITSFVVRGSRRYDAAADAISVFSSDDGKAHLNLVTCGGVWDKSAKQYTKRLVVFTDRIVPAP